MQVPFITDNKEEDVQDFADFDSNATVSECALSNHYDEFAEQSVEEAEPEDEVAYIDELADHVS